MATGNEYMEKEIDQSGIGKTSPMTTLDADNPFGFNSWTPLKHMADPSVIANINPYYDTTPSSEYVGQYMPEGNSKYDKYIGNVELAADVGISVNDLRAKSQSMGAKIGNALVNNLVIAGTVAAGSIPALVEGIFSIGGGVEKLWDNNVNNLIQNAQENTLEAFPIYRDDAYADKNIWSKMGTSVFWADIIQNLGYLEGMAIPGMGYAKLLSSAPKIVSSVVPSFLSSINEAATEAITNKEDEIEYKHTILTDTYNNKLSEVSTSREKMMLETAYEKDLQNINEDATKAGNFIFGSNIALLTLTNTLEFGKIFSRGYTTSRRLNNALKMKNGKFVGSNVTKELIKGSGRGLLNATAEGLEEVSQGIISSTPSLSKDYNQFNSSRYNPEKRKLAANLWQGLGLSLSESMNDPETANEFASGFIIGALGMPRLRAKAMPLTFEGGLHGEIREFYKEGKKSQELAESLNARMSDNKAMNSYYDGIVRHLAMQDKMNEAIDNQDVFEFNNAESAQFISDIIMFDDASNVNYLRTLIKNSVDTSEEGIANIINETSVNGEGPFMQNGNPMKSEDVKYHLNEKTRILNSKIDDYLRDKEQLESINNGELSDDSFKTALFLRAQIRDWQLRSDIIAEEVLPELQKISEVNGIAIPTIQQLENLPTNAVNKYKELLKESSSISFDQATIINNKLEDFFSIQKAIVKYNEGLKEVLTDPLKANKKSKETKEKVVKDKEKIDVQNAEKTLSSATNVSEFRQATEEIKNFSEEISGTQLFNTVLNKLKEDGNLIAKEYDNITKYQSTVEKAIKESNTLDIVKEDALKLLRNNANNAKTFEDISNKGSIYIDDIESIIDNSLGEKENATKLAEAQELLLKAMELADNGKKIEDEFSTRDHGSLESSTPTTDIKEDPQGVTSYISPIGDISLEDVSSENKNINTIEKVSTATERSMYYYPIITEYEKNDIIKGDFSRNYKEAKAAEGLDFSKIYDYLEKEGAFKYINEGKLKVGDEVEFMIDPSFDDYTIFLTSDKQVIGSLPVAKDKVAEYIGLTEIQSQVKKEFKASNSTERFYATPTTRVSKLMVGQIALAENKGIKEILSGTTQTPVFAIIKNGILDHNGKIKLDKGQSIVNPFDMSKNGRMYLLLKDIRGDYRPASVRVKHFNIEEFNPNDINIRETSRYKNIDKAINKLIDDITTDEFIKALSSEDTNKKSIDNTIIEAKKSLEQEIFLGNTRIDVLHNTFGSTLVFSHRELDNKGETVLVEKKVNLDINNGVDTLGEIGAGNTFEAIDNSDIVATNIANIKLNTLNALLDLNLPLQVDLSQLNNKNYNDELINSNILTSNIKVGANIVNNWFITDYYNPVTKKIQEAIPPKSSPRNNSKSIIGGEESAIKGTEVIVNGSTYNVNNNGVIIGHNNETITSKDSQLIKDLAWVKSNYGDARNGLFVYNGKALLPNGKILDIDTQKYLDSRTKEFKEIKVALTNRGKLNVTSNNIISKIEENQSNVDRSKTNEESYFVLEEDGKYYPYSRVHTAIGNNWIETPKVESSLKEIKAKLFTLSKDVNAFNKYLRGLEKFSKVNLSTYNNKVDASSRSNIYNIVRDGLNNTNSAGALEVGNSIDTIIRQFFLSNDTLVRPDNISEPAFTSLTTSLSEIRIAIESRGERFFANNLVLYHKYKDGTRVAGEVDILSIDTDGNFRIYDVKTSKYSFSDFIGYNKEKINYFLNKSDSQIMSTKDYYTLQLSAYKNLFESQYRIPIKSLGILPFMVKYDKIDNTVTSITKEKGIPLTYNPAVNVPLDTNVGDVEIIDNATTSNILEPKSELSGAALSIQMEQELKPTGKTRKKTLRNREVDDYNRPLWNKDKELQWLNKVLPQMNNEERVYIEKGLINAASNGSKAWGQFNDGIIILSDIAAEGTTYHEAFHIVFNSILNESDRNKVIDQAKELYGDSPLYILEEQLAEDFREYTMTQVAPKNIGAKILDLFKSLYYKARNFLKLKPSLTQFYYNINNGRYSTSNIINENTIKSLLELRKEVNDLQKSNEILTFANISNDTKEFLSNRGWTQEQFDKLSKEEKDHAIECATF